MPLYTSPALLAPGGGMATAPVIVGSGTSFFSSSGLTGYSMTHTVPAGANCLALYIGACRGNLNGFPINGVSWNGTAFTQRLESGGFSFSRGIAGACVAYLINPDAGTHLIAVDLDAAPDNCALYAINLANVDAAAPVNGEFEAATIIAHAATLSDTVATAAPTLIFGGMSMGQPPGAASYSAHAGVSELAQGTASGSSASHHFFGYRRETVEGSFSFGAACSVSSVAALAAVAFKGV